MSVPTQLSSHRPAPRSRQDPGADKHRFQYTHPRRCQDVAVDAVCSRCGVEQVDITPTAKKQTARWRRGSNGELMATKPACDDRAPLPPEQLVDALQNSVHGHSGAVRVAKSVRVLRVVVTPRT